MNEKYYTFNMIKMYYNSVYIYLFCLIDLKTLKVLTTISYLFASVNARKQKKEIKEWRPSKLEMQEGFLLHVKVIIL